MDDTTACSSATVLRSSRHATTSAGVVAILDASAAEADAVVVSTPSVAAASAETDLDVLRLSRHVYPMMFPSLFSSVARMAVLIPSPAVTT